MKNKLSKSVRKFIRAEKANIRRQGLDSERQKELINELYEKSLKTKNKKENENK